MNELMFQAGVKGMSERSELVPCNIIRTVRELEVQLSFFLKQKLPFLTVGANKTLTFRLNGNETG